MILGVHRNHRGVHKIGVHGPNLARGTQNRGTWTILERGTQKVTFRGTFFRGTWTILARGTQNRGTWTNFGARGTQNRGTWTNFGLGVHRIGVHEPILG